MVAFEFDNVLTPEQIWNDKSLYVGFQEITCHLIFNVKMDLTRQACSVVGGHVTEMPSSITYCSVISRDSVQIVFLIVA